MSAAATIMHYPEPTNQRESRAKNPRHNSNGDSTFY